MKSIGENTGITIGLVIALMGGAAFITKAYFMAEEAAKAAEFNQVDLRTIAGDIGTIKTDIAVIKRAMKDGE